VRKAQKAKEIEEGEKKRRETWRTSGEERARGQEGEVAWRIMLDITTEE